MLIILINNDKHAEEVRKRKEKQDQEHIEYLRTKVNLKNEFDEKKKEFKEQK